MPNIYFVLSETLFDSGDYFEPPEAYALAELVVAKNPSQAKYLVAKTDRYESPESNITEMPKFRCNLRKKDVDLPIGVIVDSSKCPDEWWE